MEIIEQLDKQLFDLVNHHLINWFFDLFCPIMRNPQVMYIIYIIIIVRTYQLFPKHFWKILIAGAITFAITDQLSASIIKPYFHRLRPCNDPTVNVRLLIQHCGSGFSFVSAHATNTFGMATFLTMIRQKRLRSVTVFSLWAFVVSFSQVYVGIHYPGDVIVGGIIGSIVGITIGYLSNTYFTKHLIVRGKAAMSETELNQP
ncbi:MAG: phosphatase PAP2 family protein [Bacteroidetes bacterium]|nr:phosphatase PAP2 family protein [Bacteroidota bacterium]